MQKDGEWGSGHFRKGLMKKLTWEQRPEGEREDATWLSGGRAFQMEQQVQRPRCREAPLKSIMGPMGLE